MERTPFDCVRDDEEDEEMSHDEWDDEVNDDPEPDDSFFDPYEQFQAAAASTAPEPISAVNTAPTTHTDRNTEPDLAIDPTNSYDVCPALPRERDGWLPLSG